MMANGLISWVTGVHLHDYGCTLKAYRREVLDEFRLYGETHRFIPVFAHSVGARITELPVHHHPRLHGKAKYGLERTMKVVLDLFTVKFLLSYGNKPIRLFGGTGMVLMLASLVTLVYLFARKIIASTSVTASPLLPLAIMFLILGFQSILMGLIAELLVRTYHEFTAQAHLHGERDHRREKGTQMTDWLSDNRRFLLRFAGTLLAIGLIVLLLRGQGWDEVNKAFKQLSFSQILLAFILILLSRLCVVVRWYILLRSGNVKISFGDALALTFTGLFSNNFLPTTIGGDVVRLAGAMQLGYDRAVSLASLVADRLIGALAMVFTLPFGLIPAWHVLFHVSAASAMAVPPIFQRTWDFIKRTLQTFSIWFKESASFVRRACLHLGTCSLHLPRSCCSALRVRRTHVVLAGRWLVEYFLLRYADSDFDQRLRRAGTFFNIPVFHRRRN